MGVDLKRIRKSRLNVQDGGGSNPSPLTMIIVTRNHHTVPFGKYFQIRWKEPMGREECPYLYRWTLIVLGYSVRLHHWLRSDDKRHFHDHSCNLISIVLKGHYFNCVPNNEKDLRTETAKWYAVSAGTAWFAKAKAKHFLVIPEQNGGVWTLLLQGRPYHKWGFYVLNKDIDQHVKWRPLRYFHKYGVIQGENYR